MLDHYDVMGGEINPISWSTRNYKQTSIFVFIQENYIVRQSTRSLVLSPPRYIIMVKGPCTRSSMFRPSQTLIIEICQRMSWA